MWLSNNLLEERKFLPAEFSQNSRRGSLFLLLLLWPLGGQLAQAQLGPYQNTIVGNIGNATACGTANLVRTINVTDNIIISDLDIGFLASHTWRSDINMVVTSPAGTSSAVLTGPYGIGADHYNIRLDDAAGNLVDTAPHINADTITAVPPYQNTVRPENPLNAFNGENANGVWTLSMCDVYPAADNGQFRQANLFFTAVPAVLAGSKTVEVWDPDGLGLYSVPGNDTIYSITAQNTGNGYTDSNSVFLVDSIPDDMTFYNGDIDDGGPQTDPVTFTDSGSGLSFTYASDVRYSNASAKPTDFASCNYTPLAGYDANVKHICIRPRGQMQFGAPDPEFTVKFRCRIK